MSSLSEADEMLAQAEQIMWSAANMGSDEWLLVATLLSESDGIMRTSPEAGLLARHRAVLQDVRDSTNGFTLPSFVCATRPVRRDHPHLFR
jgi:hypothetical protein